MTNSVADSVPDTATPPSVPSTTPPVAATSSPSSVPDAVSSWHVDNGLDVTFVVPPTFIDDGRNHVIEDRDRDQGLYALEDWWVDGSPLRATLAVQRDFGDDSPVVKAAFAESTSVNGILWGIGHTPGDSPQPDLRFAMARMNGYMVHISGSAKTIDVMIRHISIEVPG